jgi:dTDP-4-dehydrorhamnose 3,5-epimerase
MNVLATPLPGVFEIQLDTLEDARGSFREAWQQEKMVAAGLPPLNPVQFNAAESKYGVLRGIHAEPWDKYIHVVQGLAFAVIVDIRTDSPTFGAHHSFPLHPGNSLFVPKGMGNSYLVTSEQAVYTYLVTDHWRPGVTYPAIAFNDPDLAIAWPLTVADMLVSDKDKANPSMRELFPDKY